MRVLDDTSEVHIVLTQSRARDNGSEGRVAIKVHHRASVAVKARQFQRDDARDWRTSSEP